MTLPNISNLAAEPESPLFRGSIRQATGETTKLYFAPVVAIWRSPQRWFIFLLLVLFVVTLVLFPIAPGDRP